MAQANTIFAYNAAQTQDNVVTPRSSDSAAPSLTHEPYNKLIILLNKHITSQDRTRSDNIGAAAFIVGKRFCFFISIDNNT